MLITSTNVYNCFLPLKLLNRRTLVWVTPSQFATEITIKIFPHVPLVCKCWMSCLLKEKKKPLSCDFSQTAECFVCVSDGIL